MTEPNKMDNEETLTPESRKDTRKPADGEELTQSEQENLAGGYVRE